MLFLVNGLAEYKWLLGKLKEEGLQDLEIEVKGPLYGDVLLFLNKESNKLVRVSEGAGEPLRVLNLKMDGTLKLSA